MAVKQEAAIKQQPGDGHVVADARQPLWPRIAPIVGIVVVVVVVVGVVFGLRWHQHSQTSASKLSAALAEATAAGQPTAKKDAYPKALADLKAATKDTRENRTAMGRERIAAGHCRCIKG